MNRDRKLLLKNSLLLSTAPFLPQVINILLLPIITKYLTDVDFGIAGTIAAYTQSIGAFSTLGLSVVLLNSFFKHPYHYKYVWRQIYGFLKIWMVVYAIFQLVLLYFFIPQEAEENKWLIILLTNFSTVFFGPTATLGNSYFIYTKQSYPIVWRSILESVIKILSNYILIVHFKMGYMGWYISSFIGTFFSNATYWYVVNKQLDLKPIYKFKWKTIKKALTISLPTIPHYYTSYLLEGSGRMILDQNQVSQGEIGKISIAQQFGDVMQTGIRGLNNAISPYLMHSIKHNDNKTIKNIGLVFVSIIFSIAFGLSLWSKEIFDILLSNDSLKSAYPYFIMYLMALCYRPMYMIVSSYYFYYESTKQLLLISFLSGSIAFLIYITLIPHFGIWAFLIGHYLACLYYGYSGYFYSTYKKNTNLYFPVMWIMLIQILLTISAFFLVDFFAAKVVISIIILILIIVIILKNKHVFKK